MPRRARKSEQDVERRERERGKDRKRAWITGDTAAVAPCPVQLLQCSVWLLLLLLSLSDASLPTTTRRSVTPDSGQSGKKREGRYYSYHESAVERACPPPPLRLLPLFCCLLFWVNHSPTSPSPTSPAAISKAHLKRKKASRSVTLFYTLSHFGSVVLCLCTALMQKCRYCATTTVAAF